MISNAIPGITNVNQYANAKSAKGIAATSKQSEDFKKALSTAGIENTSASVSISVNKTLTGTGSRTEIKPVQDTAAKAQDNSTVRQQDVAAKDTENSTKVTADSEKTKDTVKNVDNKSSDEISETTEVTDELDAEEAEAVAGAVFIPDVPTMPELVIADDFGADVLEAANEIMNQLSEELGVDIEDIENAMATLGLTNVAILDPINMTQIIGEISGADDVMAIVTNADLYMNVQNMQDAVDNSRQELMQEFNFSEEEFSQALNDFAENMPNDNVSEENVNKTADFSNEAAILDIQPQNQIQVAEEIASVESDQGEVREIIPENADVALTTEEDIPVEIKTSTSSDSDTGQENDFDENADTSMFNQIMNRISSSLTEVAEPEQASQAARANTQEIMEQITEFIRINVKSESTTMELQLHPASLGTVNVMIEQAKDGNMIAKFMTQNEDVRAAIESQLQQLQEKFNEQGVKVTAVEVTVNAGGFDQTLNNSQSQKDDDQDAQNLVHKPMRRIRLGDLSMDDDGLGELGEEDQLTAEMMAINGNSVDFSA